MNVRGVNDVRQTETHKAQSLVPEPCAFQFELAIERPISHKSPGFDQIPAELIKAGSRTIRGKIHKFIITYLLTYLLTHSMEQSPS